MKKPFSQGADLQSGASWQLRGLHCSLIACYQIIWQLVHCSRLRLQGRARSRCNLCLTGFHIVHCVTSATVRVTILMYANSCLEGLSNWYLGYSPMSRTFTSGRYCGRDALSRRSECWRELEHLVLWLGSDAFSFSAYHIYLMIGDHKAKSAEEALTGWSQWKTYWCKRHFE